MVSYAAAAERRVPDEFKAGAVEEACKPGVSISAIARRIGIMPSQLYRWRCELLEAGEPGQIAANEVKQSAGFTKYGTRISVSRGHRFQ
ncbi:transposase [Ensifer adhaerens]|uniref:transposase n=1 Tax=Ensifer adhaerens TaxID=106592 RepID=UPI000DD82727